MTSTPPEAPPGYVLNDTPGFNQFAGPIYRKAGETAGQDTYHFVPGAHHMNGAGTVHGGMMMALADICLGRSVRAAIGPDARAATVSLTCDFVGPGREGEAIAVATAITRRTRTIVFIGCTMTSGGRTLMTASGVWKILDAS